MCARRKSQIASLICSLERSLQYLPNVPMILQLLKKHKFEFSPITVMVVVSLLFQSA
jgi:hypothetical protein